jgi:hypothetical protein
LHICVKICLGSLCVYCPEIIQETSVNVLQYRMHGQSSNPGRNQTWDGDNFQVKQRLATAPSTDKMTTKRYKKTKSKWLESCGEQPSESDTWLH